MDKRAKSSRSRRQPRLPIPHPGIELCRGSGRGTTPADVREANVTVGFHESCHGIDYVDFLRTHPLPEPPDLVIGMTPAEYDRRAHEFRKEHEKFEKDMRDFSTKRTDEVGYKKSERKSASDSLFLTPPLATKKKQRGIASPLSLITPSHIVPTSWGLPHSSHEGQKMNSRIKTVFGSILFVGAVAVAPKANAGFLIGAQKVTRIAMQTGTGSLTYVEFDGSRTGNPGCASSQPRKFIFDASTNRGKALLSMLTAAMYAQRPVYATGTNTCTTASFADANSQAIENLSAASVER